MAYDKLSFSAMLPVLLIGAFLVGSGLVEASRFLLEDVPTVPELSKPELPPLPKPEIPQLPKPELPTIRHPPTIETPELPKPEVPKLPELPPLPHLPELPKLNLPNIPSLPKDVPLPSLLPPHSAASP